MKLTKKQKGKIAETVIKQMLGYTNDFDITKVDINDFMRRTILVTRTVIAMFDQIELMEERIERLEAKQ